MRLSENMIRRLEDILGFEVEDMEYNEVDLRDIIWELINKWGE